MTLTVDEILRGTAMGPMQSVGAMDVIPILGEDDETFAPPELVVGTSTYGTIEVRSEADRVTIVPPGAGWVVKQAAQDHAVGGGAILPARTVRKITTAMCIQQGQGGTIRNDRHRMLILPVALRAAALSMRNRADYSKLWKSIEQFNASVGVQQHGGHLEYFLRTFAKQLDEFVAEFELVPRQLGAVIVVGGHVVGIERAPSAAFFEALWEPLIRVCYGSLAIRVSQVLSTPPSTRTRLVVRDRSLQGLRQALQGAAVEQRRVAQDCLSQVRWLALQEAPADETQGGLVLTTVASSRLAGQVVTVKRAVRYASLCAVAA